jgi:type I restriction enzyme S subunit
VCRPQSDAEPRFLHHLLHSSPYLAELTRISKFMPPSQFDILWDDLKALPVPKPPLEEQRAIADYLDAETTRIDALITKKRRMTHLLDERFESAVFHAVSKGVRGPRPMQPSGLSWVAEVPADWGSPTVSANFDLQLGKMLSAEAAEGPEHYPYVRNVNVQWDRFDLGDLATMQFTAGDRRRCELRRGDVLVCEGGEVGRAAVWPGHPADCFFQKAIHRVRPRGEANGRFLMYCLRAAAKQSVFSVEGNQSTIVHLTGEQLRSHRFPWPPVAEQREIVMYLDSLSSKRERTTALVGHQLDLLVEHRQALITAAVTGEYQVPGVS